VKWAVCIITTNAAPPNAHPMRRRHRIECLQKISSFAWQCADAAIYVPHGTSPHLSIDEPTEMLPLLSRAFGFFVGTVGPTCSGGVRISGLGQLAMTAMYTVAVHRANLIWVGEWVGCFSGNST